MPLSEVDQKRLYDLERKGYILTKAQRKYLKKCIKQARREEFPPPWHKVRVAAGAIFVSWCVDMLQQQPESKEDLPEWAMAVLPDGDPDDEAAGGGDNSWGSDAHHQDSSVDSVILAFQAAH